MEEQKPKKPRQTATAKKDEEIALLLVAESFYQEEVKKLQVKRLVVLNESGILREEGIENINKYGK